MQLLCVLAALAVLFLFCAFLTLRGGVPAAFAPLTALACIVAWLTAAGIADLLLPGVILLYLACVGLGVWSLVPIFHKGQKTQYSTLCIPGALLFWAMALCFAVYFFVRQPMAADFDEMSFWATAVKLTKTDDRLYTTATLGTPWAATQNPGLALLSYFVMFLGSYADWKIYLAYDLLYFAVYAAVIGVLPFRRYRLAVPLAAILWCTPFFLTVYNHTIYLDTTYMTAYGDVPAGMVLGGAVALWLGLRRSGGARWAVLPVLALAANIKANCFVLALVAAGLVAVDAWLFPDQKPFGKGLARRTGFAAACFAAPMLIYYFWNIRYVGAIVAKNAQEGGTGETSLPLSGVVVNGIKVLLGQPVPAEYSARTDQFLQAMQDMGHQYFTADGRLSMIGQGVIVTAFILFLFAVAVLVAPDGRMRLRIGLTGLLSLVCFGGYNLMLVLSYGFIFKPFQAESLADYNRYINSYYIGWFLMALACLVLALTAPQPAPRRKLAGEGLVLLLAVGMLFRQGQMVLPQLSVLGFSDSEFADRRAQAEEAALVCQYLTPEDRVFFVSQGDNGLAWFSAVFDFYPIIVDYSGISDAETNTYLGGGGTFGLPGMQPEEEGDSRYYFHPYTAADFDEVVRDNGCDYIYIQRLDEIFVQSYADLFTDDLAAAQAGETLLYQVTDDGFVPVEMEVAE